MPKRQSQQASEGDFNGVEFEIMTRKLQLALKDGAIHQAHHIIDRYCEEQKIRVVLSPSDPISMIAEPLVANALQDAGYQTIQSVMMASDDELLQATRNVGGTRLGRLRESLAEHGFVNQVRRV